MRVVQVILFDCCSLIESVPSILSTNYISVQYVKLISVTILLMFKLATLKLKSYGNQSDLQGPFGEILCKCGTGIKHVSYMAEMGYLVDPNHFAVHF